jgi:LPS-assembly lipoprotein
VARRGVLLAGIGVLLTGCGLHPLYQAKDGGGAGDAERGLAATSVAIIAERPGQLLREALQTRFDRAGGGVAKRYDLVVSLGIASEGLNYQQTTSSPTRLRLVATAAWSLVSLDAKRTTLATGMARTMDSFNLFNQQFFAADLESEGVQRRMMLAVADQMTLQLASWFSLHPDRA